MPRRCGATIPPWAQTAWTSCPSRTRSMILHRRCVVRLTVGPLFGNNLAGEHIAHATHRADQQRFFMAGVDLAAQPGHMTVDCPVERRPRLTTQGQRNLITAEDATGMT